MRILALVTDAFGGHGGIAKFNRDLLSAMALHPAVTEVVAVPYVVPGSVGKLPAQMRYRMDGAGHPLRFVRAAVDEVRRDRFHLIWCGHLHLAAVAWTLQRLMAAPTLLTLHGVEAWKPPRRLARLAAGRMDRYAAVSRFTQERFSAWSGVAASRAQILPNCIDIPAGPPVAPAAWRRDQGLQDRKVLLTLGRLDPRERYKGVDQVLELLPRLLRDVPGLVYLVAGDGGDRPRLERRAQDLGVAGAVRFLGYVPEQEKARVYGMADAFVMPGRGEGFGIVYLEAMAHGVPVVASSADASQEAVDHGRLGIVVNPDDTEDVRAGILAALQRPRGVVPSGLSMFSRARFVERSHALLDGLLR